MRIKEKKKEPNKDLQKGHRAELRRAVRISSAGTTETVAWVKRNGRIDENSGSRQIDSMHLAHALCRRGN
jgi:Xaa-Pro aminopeptidase